MYEDIEGKPRVKPEEMLSDELRQKAQEATKDEEFPSEVMDIIKQSGFKNIKELSAHIQALLHDKYDIEKADYDADFREGQAPYFINIWAKESGAGHGFNVFLNFLERVGVGNQFSSTDFTPEGRSLFQKAVDNSLIRQVSEPTGLIRKTLWEVTGGSQQYRKEKIGNFLNELSNRFTREEAISIFERMGGDETSYSNLTKTEDSKFK